MLRMAMSATKAMANFVGSGFKTTSVETQKQRLQVCAVCEHHTGLRCKICGRPRAVFRKFGICRICFRNMASDGLIPGVKKASW